MVSSLTFLFIQGAMEPEVSSLGSSVCRDILDTLIWFEGMEARAGMCAFHQEGLFSRMGSVVSACLRV